MPNKRKGREVHARLRPDDDELAKFLRAQTNKTQSIRMLLYMAIKEYGYHDVVEAVIRNSKTSFFSDNSAPSKKKDNKTLQHTKTQAEKKEHPKKSLNTPKQNSVTKKKHHTSIPPLPDDFSDL